MIAAIHIYDLLWRFGTPILRLNKRLLEGWGQRRLNVLPAQADVWLHAASAGEAYLVQEIVAQLSTVKHHRLLVTTNTSQGLGILRQVQKAALSIQPAVDIRIRYLPFDRPRLMRQAVDIIRPSVVAILETEIWPGMLAALKSKHVPVVFLNGRINAASLKQYMLWPSFWRALSPRHILAISPSDADRFGRLFIDTSIETMPNIKFDHWCRQLQVDPGDNRLTHLFSSDQSLGVLGSVRTEEETQVQAMMARIHSAVPNAAIAVFPRHMHRLDAWRTYLESSQLRWSLRSNLRGPVKPGTIVLWDTFGELRDAYAMATAAFVGGSFAPLGGQNFLEPLACGVIPVIGPSWFNFHWVGEEIFQKGLVQRTTDWQTATDQMIANLKNPMPHQTVRQRAMDFAKCRTGGATLACQLIEKYLNKRE